MWNADVSAFTSHTVNCHLSSVKKIFFFVFFLQMLSFFLQMLIYLSDAYLCIPHL